MVSVWVWCMCHYAPDPPMITVGTGYLLGGPPSCPISELLHSPFCGNTYTLLGALSKVGTDSGSGTQLPLR